MNLISILILTVIAVGFVMAVRYCARNGISCGECSKCTNCSGCSGCPILKMKDEFGKQ
ncbi:MAG: hypothetical protein ACOYJO_03305 [Eubacterium sp.]|jgi:hypothetical protein